jgi:signal transduction histidine kinase
MLEKQDLAAALRDMGARATAGTDIRFDVVVRGKARRLRPRVENEIFRVAQEALTNAVRHSGAARVRVEIAFGRREVALRVVDDGCGFDVAYQRSTHGPQIGLTSMKERAAELGGRLHIATRPAGGTEVELVVATSAGPAGI